MIFESLPHMGWIIDSSCVMRTINIIEMCRAGQICCIPDVYDPARIARWDPYNLHDAGHTA